VQVWYALRMDFRRAVVRVAGQFLDYAQNRAVFQQVRRQVLLHAGATDTIFDVQPQPNRRKLHATPGQNTFAGDFGVTKYGHPTSR